LAPVAGPRIAGWTVDPFSIAAQDDLATVYDLHVMQIARPTANAGTLTLAIAPPPPAAARSFTVEISEFVVAHWDADSDGEAVRPEHVQGRWVARVPLADGPQD
jgi:hypothetical protein